MKAKKKRSRIEDTTTNAEGKCATPIEYRIALKLNVCKDKHENIVNVKKHFRQKARTKMNMKKG